MIKDPNEVHVQKTFGRGDFFGEISVLYRRHWLETHVVVENCQLWCV